MYTDSEYTHLKRETETEKWCWSPEQSGHIILHLTLLFILGFINWIRSIFMVPFQNGLKFPNRIISYMEYQSYLRRRVNERNTLRLCVCVFIYSNSIRRIFRRRSQSVFLFLCDSTENNRRTATMITTIFLEPRLFCVMKRCSNKHNLQKHPPSTPMHRCMSVQFTLK